MFKMVREGQKTKIALICDYCQREITDPSMAMYAWRILRQPLRPIADGTLFLLHKGVCDHATTDTDMNHRKSPYQWEWMELTTLPAEIMRGLGMTWEQAQGRLEELGPKEKEKMTLLRQELHEWRQSANPLTPEALETEEKE